MTTRIIRAKRPGEMYPSPVSEKMYPQITMNMDDLPECDYEIGEKCCLEFTVKVVSKNESKDSSYVTFDISRVEMDDDDDDDN